MEYEEISSIRRGVVYLKPLPEPDHLEYELPVGHVCLLTDDGTDLTVRTLQKLEQRGWPVVVIRFPQQVVERSQALPEGTRTLQLVDLSEEHLVSSLNELERLYGPAAAFIHLDQACSTFHGQRITFTPSSKQVLQTVFLMAKYLKETLNKAASNGRAAFMTVVRLDGEFGLGDRYDFDPISGGLFGLVKSLNLEWEAVFCRALDLDPTLPADQACDFILAELDDPNRRLVEVGYGPEGRATLALAAETV